MSGVRDNKSDEIMNWLHSVNTDECESIILDSSSSIIESNSSIVESSNSSESGEEFALGATTSSLQICEIVKNNSITTPTFNNITVSNSENVVMGNLFKVIGNVNINVIKRAVEEQEQENVQSAEASQQEKRSIYRPACLIYPRARWLAMDPLIESTKMEEPVEFVIIGQTVTESSTVQPKNIGIIRDFQTFNVETQGFNDVVYNFFIGCDGIVYEGRGWGVEGDHTTGYNNKSIGVAFVGTFRRNLPTERALKSCQNLFIRSVVEGHLVKDYKLLSQCQCVTNNNSSNLLYEEIKNWEHFYDIKNANEIWKKEL